MLRGRPFLCSHPKRILHPSISLQLQLGERKHQPQSGRRNRVPGEAAVN